VWILVIGREGIEERDGSGVGCLHELGCEVQTATLWDRLDTDELVKNPPAAVLIEAGEEADAGRAALVRVRAAEPLQEVPVIIGITVNALSRLDVGDGFDDFVLMPYVPAELYMRIRRAEWSRSEFAQQERIKMGPLCIDLAAHEVTIDGRSRQLTHQEFALLSFLCQNRGRVFSRRQLLERVWGVDYYGSSRTVDIHVRRLRMKLGQTVNNLETVRGVGYKMKEP
jgi:DNA-binding response OmpR family regulator